MFPFYVICDRTLGLALVKYRVDKLMPIERGLFLLLNVFRLCVRQITSTWTLLFRIMEHSMFKLKVWKLSLEYFTYGAVTAR